MSDSTRIDGDHLSKTFLPQLNQYIWNASFEEQRFRVQRVIVCAAVISQDEAVIHELLSRLPMWATTQESLDWQPDAERQSLGDVYQHLQTMTSGGRDSSGRDCPKPDQFLFKDVEYPEATRSTCSHSFRLSSLEICNAEKPMGYHIGATSLKKLPGFEMKEYECDLWGKLLFKYLIDKDDDSPGIIWKGPRVPTAVVWQVQLDIVDTRLGWLPSCGSKRRLYGALLQVPELPPPPEKQRKAVQPPREQKGNCKSEYKGVRYRPDRGTWMAETRLPAAEEKMKMKNKASFGEYKSDYKAARAVDAALYYYRKGSYNFPDSPELLKTQPSLEGLEGKEKRKAVTERAKWLADNAPNPSTSPPSSPVLTAETIASPGFSRSDSRESDESGLSRSDSRESDESGLPRSDSRESDESGLPRSDSRESDESGLDGIINLGDICIDDTLEPLDDIDDTLEPLDDIDDLLEPFYGQRTDSNSEDETSLIINVSHEASPSSSTGFHMLGTQIFPTYDWRNQINGDACETQNLYQVSQVSQVSIVAGSRLYLH